jgi:glycosyltransferase involved in cell wall biosynthesis
MRILHVNKFLHRRGGAEGYMLDVAELQEKAGHEVAFFGMGHPRNPPLPYQEHFPAQVELEPPPPGLRRRAAAAARMVWSSSSRRGIAEVVRAFRPDVAHVHNIYHQLSPSVLRPLAAAGVPIVMTVHDYKLICPSYLLLDHGQACEACLGGNFAHAVLRRCKDDSLGASALLALETSLHRALRAYAPVRLFLCPSRFLAGRLAAGRVYPERLRVLNNFIDAQAIAPKPAPGGSLLYSGRLWPEKGVDVLIEALALLGDDACLEVAGDGPERPRLEALARSRAPGRVRFHGFVPRERLHELLRAAAVVALPSRSHENQPLAALEAFATGVPVVATDRGGLPELVSDRYGAIVPPDDATALAEALGNLLADPARAFAIGRAARAMVQGRHAPDRHLRDLEARYHEAAAALAGARHRPAG